MDLLIIIRILENIIINKQNYKTIETISKELFHYIVEADGLQSRRLNSTSICSYDLLDEKRIVGTNMLSDDDAYMMDYTRFRTFELAAIEIEQNIEIGVLAEIGVFRGQFAKLINMRFPDKKLYLFDSFESFKLDEYQKEQSLGNCGGKFREVYQNTSLDMVMSQMPYPQNCIVRKGFFPESLEDADKEEKFAFVSIDVDFEESTYQCLTFFYPRLVNNGYIFLHDYNSCHLGGVKAAVIRYERDNNITFRKIPLCDEAGTVVIVK